MVVGRRHGELARLHATDRAERKVELMPPHAKGERWTATSGRRLGAKKNAPGGRVPPRTSRRGFALLITITLLAFIVVLLIGLAMFTRVETAVAGNVQKQAQARENALLGLQVALGQLQKYAGPDTRVTATAQNFGGIDGTRHYTGVWSSDPAATDSPATPLTWLVSGNELTAPDTSEGAAQGATVPAPLAILPETPGNRTVDLIGRNTLGTTTRTNYVVAPLTDISATGIPGTPSTATTPIGRYAWWVGDQGVKAPVAVPDTTSAVTFAPYDSEDLRARLRQQIALGAGAAAASDGAPIFEPRDSNNSALVTNQKVTTNGQLAFLHPPNSSTAQVGLTQAQQNFHAWSPNNFAVLANSKDGGLRQDLSLKPDLLGAPFAAWANYMGYMEKFAPDAVQSSGEGESASGSNSGSAPTIAPAYGTDPLRRRYLMTPHLRTGNSGGSHQVTPVLTYFLLSFNVRTEQTTGGNPSSGVKPLEVRARWMISLWNPYTSALVPQNLQADVTGLPRLDVIDEEPTRAGLAAQIQLQSANAFGNPLRINLPWTNGDVPEGGSAEDHQSWLPGRVYTWRSAEDTTKTTSLTDGFASAFYSRTLDQGGAGVIRSLNGTAIDGNDPCHLEGSGSGQLRIRLYALRADGSRVQVGDFRSPQFVGSFSTQAQPIHQSGYQFSYVFRLAESADTPAAPGTWLTAPSRDPRLSRLSGDFFVVGENGDDPAQYGDSYKKISSPGRLLDRAENGWSYNEDVPVFELPRAPIVSLGALQHFRIVGSRPFMIGNSWGATAMLNGNPLGSLFDRFFFSGLTEGMTPASTSAGDLVLPNVLLKPLRKTDGSKVTVDEVRATATTAPPPTPPDETGTPSDDTPDETPPETTTTAPDQTDGRSSKYFLQTAAFNLNSTNAAAWAAVLRNVRFPTPESFTYLNATETNGTAADTETASVQSSDAQFFRFPQSAQETYKAEAGASAPGEDGVTPPNTHLFRKGMRTLTGAQVVALAAKIVELIGIKHTAADTFGGPFRSLEEFLSPWPLFAAAVTPVEGTDPVTGVARSLLEAAIADAGINADIAEFSSQWLTQGDIMTALAPVLFARSDTFVIRTYGETVNPAKLPPNYRSGDAIPADAVEGRAWAEAIVQRLPEYFADPANNPPEKLPSAFNVPSNPDDPTSGPSATDQLNQLHGRRFKIVSFRWLTRSDI
jgi:hypothetical protein